MPPRFVGRTPVVKRASTPGRIASHARAVRCKRERAPIHNTPFSFDTMCATRGPPIAIKELCGTCATMSIVVDKCSEPSVTMMSWMGEDPFHDHSMSCKLPSSKSCQRASCNTGGARNAAGACNVGGNRTKGCFSLKARSTYASITPLSRKTGREPKIARGA
jgi:hypothetical protein